MTINQSTIHTIYDEWYKELCIYAYRFLKDDQQAEDHVQQVIIKLWEKRNDGLMIQSLKAYLYRMVYNACMNSIEHAAVHQRYQGEVMHQLNELELQSITDADEQDNRTDLIRALEQLPERNREIMKLFYFDGLRQKEIAERLNLSVRTVETHIGNGIKKLRTIINKLTLILLMFYVVYNVFLS